jgi:predicted RNase H-like HicB family nuclease
MAGYPGWQEAELLTTLPKEIGIALQPISDGGWLASVVGIAAACGQGETEAEAEREALAMLHELLYARCELARRALAVCDG